MTSTAPTADSVVASARVDRGTQTPRTELPIAELHKRFQEAATTQHDKSALLCEIARHVSWATLSVWMVYLETGADERLHVFAESGKALPKQLHEILVACGRQAIADNASSVRAIDKDSTWRVAAVPVSSPGETAVLLVVVGHPSAAKIAVTTLELAGVYLALWHARNELTQRETETRSAATLVELLGRLTSGDDLELACYTLVNEWQRFFDCRQVVLGLSRDGRSCRVAAISGNGQVDRRSDRVRTLEATLDEALVRDELSVWPPNEASDRHATMAHKRLAESIGTTSVVSSPIHDDHGTAQGAWLFLGDEGFSQQAGTLGLIKAAETPVGSCLALLKRAERSVVQKWIRKAVEATRRWKGRCILAAIGLLIALMFVPMPYEVDCDCELQPVVRRYVAAPFDATLEKSFVEPGDLVSANQPLARIDGREIRWELAGVDADRSRAAKERDGHRATHDFGAAEVAKYEMERLKIKAELLEHRGTHLELRSPIDGIVISGDLKKAEGVPLTVGQTLFEIAPLDSMIVEIAIPEEDIRHVRAEQSLEVVLDAYPGQRFEAKLSRIHPRSEVRETEHVFIGEFELDNPDETLRPGMQGTAAITTSYHTLGWNLFHKPCEKMLYWMGW